MYQAHDMVAQLRASPIQCGVLILVQMNDDLQLSHIVHLFNVLLVHSPNFVHQFPAA